MLRDGNYEIYSMNPDGSEATRLTNDPEVDLMGAWSPDGRRIAFTSARDNPLGDLYTMNADGTGIIRLTFGPGASGLASWSKDGKKLVFVSSRDAADPAANDDTGNELYTMTVADTGVTRLTSQNATLEYPSWDPHGRRIAFSNTSVAGHDVYVIGFDGAGLTRLTFGGPGGGDLYPTWSPDGNKIAFASGRDGNAELYSMNADGTGQTRLTNSPGDDLVARWSR